MNFFPLSISHGIIHYIGHTLALVSLTTREAAAKRITSMSIADLPLTSTPPLFERIPAAKKAEVVSELSALLGTRYVLHTPYDLMLYEYDASIDRSTPDIVVLPASTTKLQRL